GGCGFWGHQVPGVCGGGFREGPGSGFTGSGSERDRGQGSEWDRRQGSEWDRGQGSEWTGSGFRVGPGSGFREGPGPGLRVGPGSGFREGPGSGFRVGPGSGFREGPGPGLRVGPGPGRKTRRSACGSASPRRRCWSTRSTGTTPPPRGHLWARPAASQACCCPCSGGCGQTLSPGTFSSPQALLPHASCPKSCVLGDRRLAPEKLV
uniref:Uncharacterized protein n=1 Tax=Sus scrofa TaxID=9823 RepID=A0A4X1SFQ8_PIG